MEQESQVWIHLPVGILHNIEAMKNQDQRPSFEPEYVSESNIVTAEKARELYNAYNKKERLQKWIFRRIRRKARCGEVLCHFKWVNEVTRNELIKRGFTTYKHNLPGDWGWTINW